MSYNDFLSITGNTITIQNINTNDVWNITVIDANFMLSKYNGRGTDSVNIIPFPNIGDGLYGDIVLSVNNNPCFKGCVSSSEGEGTYFNVSPKYITLHKKNDTYNINVSSDCTDLAISTSSSLISVSEITNGISTVTSNTDEPFENNIVIVTNNCNGLQEKVYVSQKPSQEVSNILTVNPQYITLSGEDKNFKINVISMCSGNTNYTYDGTIEGLSLTKNGNIINGTVNSTEDITKTFTVKNDCYSKTVTVIYTKASESSHYMWIKESGTTSVTGVTFDSVDDTFTYKIGSSSNWYIYDYDSSKVKCSKTVVSGDSNYIKITLGEDKSKCNNYEIILKNIDNDEVKVIYSIVDGLVSESGITFKFDNDDTILTINTIKQITSSDDISFNACVFAYDSNNKPVNWRIKNSTYFITTTTDLSGGISGNSKCVKFEAKEATKKSKTKNYTVILVEQETYKEISIKISIERPQENISSNYHIEISPESGTYSMSEVNNLQISVTPSYVYDDNTYFYGNWDSMKNLQNYKGVACEVSSNEVTLTLDGKKEDIYDTFVYNVNGIVEGMASFTVCATATTQDGSEKQESVTACTTISLTSYTAEVSCEFTTGSSTVEIGGEASTVEETLYSKADGEIVPINVTLIEGDGTWFNITQDSYGEAIYINCDENTDFNERIAKVSITQNGGCDEGEFILTIKQYSNQTIFIPNFDYLVIRYFWSESSGRDLDTVTVIPYLLKEDGVTEVTDNTIYTYLDKGVGFLHGTPTTDEGGEGRKQNYVVSGDSGVYIMQAGDNTVNGNECVYLNFKNLCSEEQVKEMLKQGIEKIRVNLYGVWYSSKGNGNIDVSLIAYKDGTMIDDPSDEFNFTNDGGTEVYNEMKFTKVCSQGSGKASTYKDSYTNIGYVEYNIKTASATLSLNTLCQDSNYVLSRTESTSSLTISYLSSTNNFIAFNSTKDGAFFNNITIDETCNWLSDFVTTSTTNPMMYSYTVTENTTSSERLCGVKITQGESGQILNYQIRQQANNATLFSLSETEELREITTALTETQTSLKFFVLSCKNYNSDTNTGNRLDYEETHSCGTNNSKTEEGDFKYWQTYDMPITCTSGTIVLRQKETNQQITINFSRTCACVSQETINATVTLSRGEKYELNGSYYFNITATAILNKKIECGSATVTVYYGVGIIDNASFSEIVIPNKSNSGTVTNTLTIGVTDEYDENFTMDCIHSSREGSVITFTNNSCYVAGTVTINVNSDSLCQACNCEVTTVSITPSNYSFMENEEKIFTLKVETSTCDSCTKGYKFYDPNGHLVTAGTSENTVKLSYNNIIEGDYELISDDDNTKIAYLTVGKTANEYEIYATGTTIDPPAVEAYVTITSLKNGNPYSDIMLSETCNWVTSYNKVSSSNGTYQYQIITLPNTTTSSRTCTVTVSQEGGESTTFDITQEGATPEAEPTPPEEPTPIVYQYTFKNCYSDRQIGLFASNATPSGSHLQFAMLSALDGTAATVLVTSNNGTMVNGSSSNSSSYAKIGDSVKVYSVTNTTNIWTLEETITLTASNRSFEYGCSSTPTSCTCSVTSISVSPTTHTFTSNSSNSFTVTINDNDCDKCKGGFKVYNSSGTYVTSGTSTFSLSNQSGTFTIRANDNTGKTCTLTTTKYTAPVYVFKFNNPTGGFDSTSTETNIIHKPSYEGGGPTTTLTSTKDGSNVGYTMSSNVSWITTSTAATTCSWTISKNTSTSSRSGTITLTQSGSNKTLTISVTQSGAPATCDCSTVSISCNPTNSYTTGNSVSTVVTVNAGSNCSTKWKAYSSSGSYLGEGNNGGSLSRTTTGTVTFRSDACTGKTTTWTISKPECAKPTIRLSGSGDAYMLQNYSETDEWCGTNPNVSVSTSADYIGDGSDYTHYSPTTCSFEIANCAASITSFNLDSGGWVLDEHSGLNAFGISFTIRPDAIVNATCTLSGTFTYLMQGTPFSGTFSISIQFNG